MGLDIRIPLGLIFLITGGLMTGYGVLTRGDVMYAKSMGVNLNLVWGGVMVVFGAVMFFVGRRQRWQDDVGSPRPWERDEGRPEVRR